MGVIREVQTTLGTVYERYSDKGELIQTAGAVGFVKEYEEYPYFIITDLNGRRIREANRYLNIQLSDCTYKKREGAFTALKLFYSCINLFNFFDYKNGLQQSQLRALLGFLEGGKKKGTTWDIDFQTIRCNQTTNNYLSVYRDFYKKMFNINDSLLHSSFVYSEYSGGGFLGHANKQKAERYDVSKKVNRSKNAPKYIKQHEYDAIMELVEKKYTLREMVILKLMYEYGLRLGEVLGLTLEDIEEGSYNNHLLFLRNRVTDKPWQKAKGVMNVTSREDYNKPAYQMKGDGLGYQTVVIGDEMFELLEEFFDETRDEVLLNRSIIKRENLEKRCKADLVTDRDDLYDGNSYIFLSRQNYLPLTSSGWNFTLRKIFTEMGLKVDKETKEDGLSHRFRHGFAMVRAKCGHTHHELAKALRHSGTSTVMKYYNPDEEDQVELLNRQREHMKKGGVSFE